MEFSTARFMSSYCKSQGACFHVLMLVFDYNTFPLPCRISGPCYLPWLLVSYLLESGSSSSVLFFVSGPHRCPSFRTPTTMPQKIDEQSLTQSFCLSCSPLPTKSALLASCISSLSTAISLASTVHFVYILRYPSRQACPDTPFS